MTHSLKTKLYKSAGAFTLSLCIWGTASQAFDINNIKPNERDAFHAEIRNYLISNPEVLIEALEVFQTRQAQAQANSERALLSSLSEKLYNTGDDLILGNPEGDITIVEFLDYRCGYCKRAYPEMKTLLENDKNVRLILKEYPILGDASVLASRFAIATRAIGGDQAYSDAHDALMELNGNPSQRTLARIAKDIGLDYDEVKNEMNSLHTDQIISNNRQLGQHLQISGTPSFLVSDEILRGYLPYDQMAQLISEIRQRNEK